MTKKICILILCILFNIGVCIGQIQNEMTIRENVKKKLDFDNYINTVRDGEQYFFLNMDRIILPDPKYIITNSIITDESTKRYVFNIESIIDEKKYEMCFYSYIFPLFTNVYNFQLEKVAKSPIHISDRIELWEKQNITYGDVSFGRRVWSIGNVVFLLRNRKYDLTYVDNFYNELDKLIRSHKNLPTLESDSSIVITQQNNTQNSVILEVVTTIKNNIVYFTAETSVSISRLTDNKIEVKSNEKEGEYNNDQEKTINLIILSSENKSSKYKINLFN